MFLVERIIGVSLYVFFLIMFCFLLNKAKTYKNVKNLLFAYLLILSIMAFLFVPNIGSDLYRINILMHIYAKEGINSFIQRLIVDSSPISLIYYRLIGKIGIDNFLPFITTLICYRNLFYVLYDYSKKNEINSKSISLCLLSIMCTSTFMLTISNIRTMISFSIILRCSYDEMFNNKSFLKNIFFYVIASLIHNVAVILLAIRFFVYFFNTETKKSFLLGLAKKIILCLCLIVVVIYGKNIIISTGDKASSYLSESKYNYFWENLIGWLYFLFLFRTVLSKHARSVFNINKGYKLFSILIIILIISFCFQHSIFTRFISFSQFFLIPYMLERFNYIVKQEKESNYKVIFLYLFIILILSCTRGNLCSLKFWE